MPIVPIDKLQDYVGKDLGTSDWIEINQDRVNAFADCTEDHQWIHVDEEKAKAGPFGQTIAHGYLTLSMLVRLAPKDQVVPEGIKMAINYGLNKVRFINPVKVGKKIRNKASVKEITDKGGGRFLISIENVVEIEGEEKPACIAESLAMFFT